MTHWIRFCIAVTVLAGCTSSERSEAPATTQSSDVTHPRLVIEPYLTQLTESSALLNWRLAEPGASSFRYAEAPWEQWAALEPEGEKGRQRRVRLDGLQPGVVYRYRVNGGFEGEFQTPGLEADFRFVAVGHTHGTEQFDHYPDALLAARVAELKPDFLVHTGDMTYYATPEDFGRYFFELFGNLIRRVPVFAAPGNHDAGWPFVFGPRLSVFRSLFAYPYPPGVESTDSEAHYSIRWQDVRFFFLSYSTGIAPGSSQRRWLAKALALSTETFNIAVYGGAQRNGYDEDELLTALREGGIDLLLSGDGLAPQRLVRRVGGLPIVEVGTWGGRPHPFAFVEKHGYYLTAKLMDAAGVRKTAFWVYSKRRFAPKVDLLAAEPKLHPSKGQVRVDYSFSPPLRSDEIRGLQLLPGHPELGKTLRFLAYLEPVEPRTGKRGEGGFRTQYQSFSGRDPVVTMLTPQGNPFDDGKPYEIRKLRIYFHGIESIEELKLQGLYLF